MIIVRKEIGEEKILEVKASGRHGDGVLCVTNLAVAYEVDTRGLYLNFIPREMVKRIGPVSRIMFGARKFRINWTESGSEHSFEFRTKQHELVASELHKLGMYLPYFVE